MMGGGAFILLKAGRPWPESAKQAEIRLAILLKILHVARLWGAELSPGLERTCDSSLAVISAGYG
jgi:hypothetical protein